MAIEDSQREFTERRPPLKSAVDAGDPPVRIGTPELDGQPNPFQSWTPPSEPDLVRRWKSRLVGWRLRSELRARPDLQGRVLAPAGTFRRLPRTPALYFPFYHDVPRQYAGRLRQHLLTFSRLGQFSTWDDALAILDGGRELAAPHFCLSFDDGHRSWVDVVLPILDSLGIPATFFISTDFISSDAVGGGENLTWRDCRSLVAGGMSVGSHTRSHRRLLDLDDEAASHEIRDSKSEIEDRLGVPVRDFAAPYGWPGRDFEARHVGLARQAGYRSFATTLRTAMQAGDSPLFIHRQGLHPAWPLRAVMTRVHE